MKKLRDYSLERFLIKKKKEPKDHSDAMIKTWLYDKEI